MKPIVNLEETPGKQVGRVKQQTPREAIDRFNARFQGMGLTLPFPKGVFRFKTFEEADEWEMKILVQAAVKRLRGLQR